MTVKGRRLKIFNNLVRYLERGARIISSSFRAKGLRSTLRLAIGAFLSIHFYYRLEKVLTNPEEKVIPKIPLAITIISDYSSLVVEDMNKILKLRGDYGIINFHERIGRGDVLFCAHSDRKLMGFVWLDIPPVAHRNAGYSLKNDEAFTYDSYTFKEYRGNRIMPAIQQAIFVYLREKHPDIHSIVTQIQIKNKPSIAGDKRAGYIITGRDFCMVILGYFASFRLIRYRPYPRSTRVNKYEY